MSADWVRDPGFNPDGVGANGGVLAMIRQADDRLLIAGNFSTYNGSPQVRIARLNADGSLDASFDAGSGVNGTVNVIALQPDGRILLGGAFSQVDGTSRQRIARLNANGSLDSGFDPGANGFSAQVRAIAVQADGRLLVGGDFSAYNSVPVGRITRLNGNGSLDASFDAGTGAGASVHAVSVQADGRILIGGAFTSINDTARYRIARLHANGSLDSSFDPGSGLGGTVQAIALQADGRILVGGQFTTPHNRITRLNGNGSLDSTFVPGTAANGIVRIVAIQPDGRVLIGGDFSQVAGQWHRGVARLNADGSRDPSFTFGGSGAGPAGAVYGMAAQTSGRIAIAGVFSSFSGGQAGNVARLVSDGVFADRFQPEQ
ncbi:MAG: delta-60 repeat domain-containing protein [Wenzhouxiangella sp.]|nr:delta-60 repeat domain-containing protein [Wenzhouxiangella sp.]